MRFKSLVFLLIINSIYVRCCSQDIAGGEFTIIPVTFLRNTYDCYVYLYTKIDSTIDRQFVHLNWGDGNYGIIPRVADSVLSNDIKVSLYFGSHIYPGPGAYNISISDSFRISGILNIQNSGFEPFYQEKQLIINPFIGNNSSSYFLNLQTDVIYNNGIVLHDAVANDFDNDSMNYELILCNTTGYYLPAASNILAIDPYTGYLTWDSPVALGKYQICIKVTEWKNGIKVWENVRDMIVDVNNLSPIYEHTSKIVESIYPNPSDGIINIKTEKVKDIVEIKIISLEGHEVMVLNNIPFKNFVVDLSEYPKGIYLVKLIFKDSVVVRKAILH